MTPPSLAARRIPILSALGSLRPSIADVPVWGGGLALIVGLVVLIRWVIDPVSPTIFPGIAAMKANTAVCFLLLGAGAILLSRAGAPPRRALGRILIGVALVIAALTWIQDITSVNLGIDELLFPDISAAGGVGVAGRMSPVTAIGFLLLGLAALLGPARPRLVVALCGATLAVAILTILNLVFDSAVPPFLAGYTEMAPSTALALVVLALGVIGLLGTAGPFALLVGRSPGASLLRRVLALLIAAPVIMIAVTMVGQRLGLYDQSFGISLRLLGTLMIGVIAVMLSAGWVKTLEAQRDASDVERRRFFELSPDMLSVMGADGRFRRANQAWNTVLGYPESELVGHSYLEYLHPDDVERTNAEAARLYGLGETIKGFQNRYRHRDGTYRWLEWMSSTSPDQSLAYGVARDVTERKRRDDQRATRQHILEARNETLSERVIRDPLTGLHNRRYFDTQVARLERRWRHRAAEARPPVAVIMFDLDHFGQVNKQHGHQAGDAVLRVFSGLLARRFRERDLVARYGGEEFVAVLANATASQATAIAEDLRSTFEATPIDIGNGAPIHGTVSAGCAQLGADGNAMAALAEADVWLAQAKRGGRNQVVGI